MSVVNVKVKHIRPEYANLKEWTSDLNNVYIGRRGIVFVNKERYPKMTLYGLILFASEVKLQEKMV
jgi:hypothetical protein